MIDIQSVTFHYDGTPILRDVSATVAAGQTFVIMGANGAGKTTLLRLIAGLIEPDEGLIEIRRGRGGHGARDRGVDGVDVGGQEPSRDATDPTVGFAPENPDDGLFAGTVREELEFFPRNRGLSIEDRVPDTLARFGLEAIASRTPQTLSMGEKRLVSLASVLAGDPAVVALDEPTSGLDMFARDRLIDRIEAVDRTVVIATHDSEFACRIADEVMVLDEGRLHRHGSTTVLKDGSLDFAALGLREPGAVRWAREHDFDRVPASAEQAAEWLSGGDGG